MTTPARPGGTPGSLPGISREDVAAFLRANPRFLTDHPELYRLLEPPMRLHGEQLADHMAAMLAAERLHAAAMAERADGVLAAGRASAGLAARVHEAVLALIASDDVAECVAAEFPSLLAIDAATLCAEVGVAGARVIPAGTVERLLGSRTVVFRDDGSDCRLVHGEAAALARHDALVRVPADRKAVMLALVARDQTPLHPAQGTGALAFLGRAVAAALRP